MTKLFLQLAAQYPSGKVQGGTGNPEISGISHDTRSVKPGDLFICIAGYKEDGHNYASAALDLGAKALVVQKYLDQFPSIPQLVVSDSRMVESILAAAFFDYPSRKMRVVGITGTNGKTTTSYMLESILKESGFNPGVIGTITYRFAGKEIEAHNTTPSALELNKLLAEMVDAGCDHLIMEVSSHSLVQGRVDSIDMDYAIFTHITRDHLDFHGTMENYLAAKCLLFSKIGKDFDKGYPKRSIINIDDAHAGTVIKSSTVPVLTYGLNEKAGVRADMIDTSSHGLDFILITPNGDIPISLQMAGYFNAYNALAATGAAIAMDIPQDKIKQGLEKLSHVPGRFQSIRKGQNFKVLVDYAHTDDALLNVLKSARQITKGRIIVVFGAGGDRDRGKRPMMGEVAAKNANEIIVTSDNPRSEDPALIALDIEIGIKRVPTMVKNYKIILDRADAIKSAIHMAQSGDTVILAGKGHENYQVFSDKTIHFDDTEVAAQYLEEITKEK